MTTAPPDYENVEIPRDHWGRPLVLPPQGGKRVAYRRTTTFVGCLDDTTGLQRWKTRMVALGMGQRKDLTLAAAAANPDDKKTLDDIAEKALEQAQAGAAAMTGTALHSLTERIDRGQELGHVPHEYVEDLKAYEKATAHIEWLDIECFRVHDEWQVAGTADRIGRDTRTGRITIQDIKGLALDTKLPTPDGWTTMGQIQVGDQVFDETGSPCTVILKSDTKQIGTYIVTFDDDSKVVCDSEHIWWTTTELERQAAKRRGIPARPRPRPISEIIESAKYKGQSQHVVPVASALQLPEVELPAEPYALGCWLGDGHTNRNVITKEDALFDILESDGHILGKRWQDPRSGSVSRGIVGFHAQLAEAGVLGHKHIPDRYQRGSEHQRLRLLQGLMDTDGTWNTARNRAMFTSTTKELALGVEQLLLGLGVRPHVAEVQRTGFGKTVTAYDVEFTVDAFMPFRLARKVAKVAAAPRKNLTRARRRVIVSVEPGADVETACIGVDSPNNVYLCSERFIPTHNTGSVDFPHKMAMQLAMYADMIPYDIATDTRGVNPDGLDVNDGVIIHLPAGQGRCDLYSIDLRSARGACALARKVWAWRGQKGLTRLLPPGGEDAPITPTWELLIAAASTVDELRVVWMQAKDSGDLNESLKALCMARSAELGA